MPVAHRLRLLSLLTVLACSGCDTSEPPGQATSGSGATHQTAPAVATAPLQPTSQPTPPKPPAPSPAELQQERFRAYASWLTEPDDLDCKSYGLILSVTWPSQHSRAVWVTEVLRTEPSFLSLLDSGEIKLLDATYGERNYGRSVDTPDISRQAYVIECSDHVNCRAFAGFYARVDPWAKVRSYCGALPGRSGGDYPIKIDSLLKRPRSFPHAVCARYRSCLAFSQLAAESCDGLTPSARVCAEFSSCDEALKCISEQPRDPQRILWSDNPENRPSRSATQMF